MRKRASTRLARVSTERMHLALMLVLTFGTGIVDAVGYLGLDRVFTGNMTGNVVILGMALVGGDGLPVLGPVLALVGFMAGAALGGRVLRDAPHAWTRRTNLLLLTVGVLVLALAARARARRRPGPGGAADRHRRCSARRWGSRPRRRASSA